MEAIEKDIKDKKQSIKDKEKKIKMSKEWNKQREKEVKKKLLKAKSIPLYKVLVTIIIVNKIKSKT